MNCENITGNLSAYLDQELPSAEMEQIKVHLTKCSSCRQNIAELQQTIDILRSLDEVIPPASFRRELRSKLEQGVKGNVRPKRVPFRDIWQGLINRRYAIASVAVAMIFLVVIAPFAIENYSLKSYDLLSSKSTEEAPYNGSDGMNIMGTVSESEIMQDRDMRVYGSSTKAGGGPMYTAVPLVSPAQAPLAADDAAYVEDKSLDKQIELERKIIKNADLMLRVDDYEQTVAEIKQQLIPLNGYLANESINARDDQGNISGYLRIRLPHEHFDSFIDSLGTLGKLRNSNIYTQNVTEEFVDVESRLKVMQQKEERLLAILDKAGQLADILAVENELAHTRAEIESLVGRLRYLNNRVDYSTISLNLEQVAVPTQNLSAGGLTGVFGRAVEAFIISINSLLVGLGKLIVFIFAALPVLILIVLIFFIIWRIYKKKRNSVEK